MPVIHCLTAYVYMPQKQRPWAGSAPPGAVCYFAPDRKGEHVRQHLQNSSGILQADAYAGFNALYEKGADGKAQFHEAACWAHLRRDFHDVLASDKSQIAREALDRIGKLYDIEREIAGQSAGTRLAAGQKLSTPIEDAFQLWAEQQRTRIFGKSDLAKAFRYGLSRWPSFCLLLTDARVAIDSETLCAIVSGTMVERRRAGDATNWDWTEKLALCRGRYRRENPGSCHDPDRNR